MKCKQAKWLPEEALQIAEERRKAKGKGGRERDTNCMQISREEQGEIRKPSLMNNAKKQRKIPEQEKLAISSKKFEISKKYFLKGWTG